MDRPGACFNIFVWYHTVVVQTKKQTGPSGALKAQSETA